MDKLREKVKSWKITQHREEDATARSARLTKAAATAFAGARNFKLQDTHVNIARGDMVTNNSNITHVHNYGLTSEMHEAFRRLVDPKGCAWDPSRVCQPGTRLTHIEETIAWIQGPIEDGGCAQMLLVAQGAGSGKSALAHSICQRAYINGHLVASFFFNQLNSQNSTYVNLMAAVIRGICDISEDTKKRIGEALVGDSSLVTASPDLQFQQIILPVCPFLPSNRPYVIVIDALDELRDVSLLKLLRDSIPQLPSSFRIFLTTRPEQRIMMYLEKRPHIRQPSYSLTGDLSHQDLDIYIRRRLEETAYGSSISEELLALFVAKTEGVFLWGTTVLNHLEEAFDPVMELQMIIESKSDHWKDSPDATKQLDDIYSRILSKMQWTDTKFVKTYQVVVGALVTLQEPMSPIALASLYAHDGITVNEVSRLCVLLRPLLHNFQLNENTQTIRLLHLSVQQFLIERAPSPYRLDCDYHHMQLSRNCLLTLQKELTPQNIPILGYSILEREDSADAKIPALQKSSVAAHIWYSGRFFNSHTLLAATDHVSPSHIQLLHALLQNPRYILELTASMGRVVDLGEIRSWLGNLNTNPPPLPMLAAQSFCGVANCLQSAFRSREACKTSKEAIDICRAFVDDDPDLSVRSRLAISLCVMSESLSSMWPADYEASLQVSQEGLDLVRALIKLDRDRFQSILARLLINHSHILRMLRKLDDSVIYALEAVEIGRMLASTDQVKYATDLVSALQHLASELRSANRSAEAVPIAEEEIDLRRKLVEQRPPEARDAAKSDLAWTLSRYGTYLTGAGRKEEALIPLKDSTGIYRQLAAVNSDEYGRLLASSLSDWACILNALQRYEEGIRMLVESLDIIRKSSEWAYDDNLLTPLWGYASALAHLKRLDEAIPFAQEALEVCRVLKSHDPDMFNFAVAWSLNILSFIFNSCQRYSEAEPLGEEAIQLYREMAEAQPDLYDASLGDSEALHDRFYPSDSDLANSLYTYSLSLAGLGRRQDALKEAREAVDVLQRMVARYPGKFQGKLSDASKLVNELEVAA
ncbi:hypothetical protein FA15DRAFT_614916 [Coprinopsis marcescibilis]|uniref:Nephrocystin 3-like N-terminal domain-containing protein n=1 Tax=Coprinopsis marcescibilis TaxID=230819 RepID=A0A5C3L1Y8_COPMA|nr:hypothetical protein FA15DRAFT_614916 [Coprinopsis marcescibilis]